MRRRLAYVLVPLAIFGLSAGLIGGCKQKEGERCQVNDDCETGVCAVGNGVCVVKANLVADTNLAPDVMVKFDAPVDAKPADGPFDAP